MQKTLKDTNLFCLRFKFVSYHLNWNVTTPRLLQDQLNIQSFLLTHDLHHSVSQEGSAALQVAEALDVQWPHVGGGVAVGHPLGQVPESQSTRHAVCATL